MCDFIYQGPFWCVLHAKSRILYIWKPRLLFPHFTLNIRLKLFTLVPGYVGISWWSYLLSIGTLAMFCAMVSLMPLVCSSASSKMGTNGWHVSLVLKKGDLVWFIQHKLMFIYRIFSVSAMLSHLRWHQCFIVVTSTYLFMNFDLNVLTNILQMCSWYIYLQYTVYAAEFTPHLLGAWSCLFTCSRHCVNNSFKCNSFLQRILVCFACVKMSPTAQFAMTQAGPVSDESTTSYSPNLW